VAKQIQKACKNPDQTAHLGAILSGSTMFAKCVNNSEHEVNGSVSILTNGVDSDFTNTLLYKMTDPNLHCFIIQYMGTRW